MPEHDLRVLKDLDVAGKTVVLRADLDVDTDSTVGIRLLAIRGSVDYVFEKGAMKITIIGHRKRPEGFDPKLSTRLLIDPLQKILERKIAFAPDFDHVPKDDLVLFENLRFWKGERNQDETFAQKLAGLGDVCVSDAFGTFHRNNTSISLLPLLIPSGCGIQAEKEYLVLSRVLQKPDHPFVAIVGGAKIQDKVSTIKNLSRIANTVLVGGLLPIEIKKEGLAFDEHVLVANLTTEQKDIDQNSIKKFAEIIGSAKMIVWNGTVGHVEARFTKGTDSLIKAIVETGAYSVVGGGDTTQYLYNHNLQSHFNHVSTGGGAMLEFLSGSQLPGFEVLRKKP
jgi:phosphoglycerate kinase